MCSSDLEVILAHNANRTVPDFLRSGTLQARASVATLASAMDVGNPSNLERLRAMFPELAALREAVPLSTDASTLRFRRILDRLRETEEALSGRGAQARPAA